MITKKFLKSSILYSVAGALPMASMVILVPLYLLLPVEEYGALAIYTTFSTLLQILITYSFDNSLYVHYHDIKTDSPRLATFVSSAFAFIAIAGVAALIIGLLSGDLVFSMVWAEKSVSFYPYGLMSIVTAAFQAFFKVHSSLTQSRENPLLFFWSNVLSFSLIAGLTAAGLLLFPGTLIGPVGGRMIAAIACGSWAFVRIIREFGFQFDLPLLKTTFAYNNVTFIYQVQQWVINSIDRLLIGLYLTLTDVGTYDFAFKCMLLITFIADGLNNAIQPKVLGIIAAQPVKETTVQTNRYYYGLTAVTMLMACAIILLVPLVFDSPWMPAQYQKYAGALSYLPFLGILYFIRTTRYYFVLPFAALKYVKPLPVIYLLISAMKVLLMLLLLQKYHVYAVILSAGVSSVVEIAVLHIVLRERFHFRFNLFKLILAPVFLGGVILALEITGLLNEHLRHAAYAGCCLVILAWGYRNELKQLKPSTLFK